MLAHVVGIYERRFADFEMPCQKLSRPQRIFFWV